MYSAKVPTLPAGGVYVITLVQYALGYFIAGQLVRYNVESELQKYLNLNTSTQSYAIVLGFLALMVELMYVPAKSALITARNTFKIGHPIHHGSREDFKSESDRIKFLSVLRAYENGQEQLPQFIMMMIGLLAFALPGTAFATIALYSVGRLLYSVGYGTGSPLLRAPGLLLADMVGLGIARGVLLLRVAAHFGYKF